MICFIRFLTFSFFEININYLSFNKGQKACLLARRQLLSSQETHLFAFIVYLFLSQEPQITWSSPQDYFPKHLFNNWQLIKNMKRKKYLILIFVLYKFLLHFKWINIIFTALAFVCIPKLCSDKSEIWGKWILVSVNQI